MSDYTRPGSKVPLPCWETCWEPLQPTAAAQRQTGALAEAALESARAVDGRLAEAHCTAPCPAGVSAEPGAMWRRRWDQELVAFKEDHAELREFVKLTDFIQPLPDTRFFFSVF